MSTVGLLGRLAPMDALMAIVSRNSRGVTLFKVADDEHIVSVAKLQESEEDETGEDLDTEESGEAIPEGAGEADATLASEEKDS